MINMLKYAAFFLIGGSSYFSLEILWRGRSHISMFIAGGLCFLIIGFINDYCFKNSVRPVLQVLASAASITAVEFISGVILNLHLKMNVWDYSGLPFNALGQVCLYYFLLWIPVSIAAIELDNVLKFLLFGRKRIHFVRMTIRR
jgi:hypothetical protein